MALAEALRGGQAWNLDPQGDVPDGSFYQHRNLPDIEPERFVSGPWDEPAPIGPLKVLKRKKGSTKGFVARDARGRKWLFKFDAPGWPELGTAAEAIGARIAWAMGYHVPPTYVVTVKGTGHSRYDGRRAVAVRYIPGKILRHWKFDWLRYRREIRALRLVCMWINEIDHGDNNTLISWDGRRATYWLIDFNSSLGSWQGKPKSPGMGWLHVWDPQWQLATVLSLGTLRPGFDPHQPIVSPAVGRFDSRIDVRQWRPRQPNPAFNRLTDADARWMIRVMQQLSDEQLAAIVRAGRYSDPADAAYVRRTLRERRKAIVEAYIPSDPVRGGRKAGLRESPKALGGAMPEPPGGKDQSL